MCNNCTQPVYHRAAPNERQIVVLDEAKQILEMTWTEFYTMIKSTHHFVSVDPNSRGDVAIYSKTSRWPAARRVIDKVPMPAVRGPPHPADKCPKKISNKASSASTT
jgi:hypothetical protein